MTLLTDAINPLKYYIHSMINMYIIITVHVYPIGLYRVVKAIYEIIFSIKFP